MGNCQHSYRKCLKIGNKIIVYTQPACPRCNTLKKWFKKEGIKFEEKLFDTEVQTKMIMMNLFDDPPFLGVNGKVLSSSILFDPDGSIIEPVIRGCLDE